MGFLQKENELMTKEKENLIKLKELEKKMEEDKKIDTRLNGLQDEIK